VQTDKRNLVKMQLKYLTTELTRTQSKVCSG